MQRHALVSLFLPAALYLGCDETSADPSGNLDAGGGVDVSPRPSVDAAGGDVDGPADAAPPDADAGNGAIPFATSFHVAVSNSAACAVFPDGRMKCWGSPSATANAAGQVAGEMGAALPFVTLPERVRRVRADGEANRFCLIFEGGGLRCWGDNPGQVNVPARLDQITTNVDVGPGRTVLDVAPGAHSCAVLDNGQVKCWGGNSEGQLGLGDDATRNVPASLPVDLGTGRTAKAIAVGFAFSCALLDNDRVKCWGRNSNISQTPDGSGGTGGMLAIGGTAHMGNAPGEMGDNLPFAKLGTNPGTGQPWKVKKIGAGRIHACALLENGRVKCWGRNDGYGVVGSGDSLAYGNTLVDDAIPFVDVGTNPATAAAWTVTDLAVADSATCVVVADGTIRCWGSDSLAGLLGRGTANATIGGGPGEMGSSLLPVPLFTGRTATSVSAGLRTMCALVGGSTLNCWGSNQSGVLGQGLAASGTTNAIGDAPGEMGAALVETRLE